MTYLRKGKLRDNTRARIAAMRRLVEFLSTGAMQREDIRLKMHICEGSCRKYLADLESGGVVEMQGRAPGKGKLPGQPIFALVADAEQIEQFFRSAAGFKPKRVSRHIDLGGRRFHILADDGPYSVKYDRLPVAPDPFALPVEFFRSAHNAGAVQCG